MRSVFLVMMCGLSVCQADEQWAAFLGTHYRFGDEITTETPLTVDDDGGHAFALQIWAPDSVSTNWQLYASSFDNAFENEQQNGEFQIRHLHIGGIKAIDDERWMPYVGFAIGPAEIRTDIEQEVRWAFSLSGGARWRMTSSFSVLFEARWLGILFNSATALACDRGNCQLQFDSGAWSQYEFGVYAGVKF